MTSFVNRNLVRLNSLRSLPSSWKTKEEHARTISTTCPLWAEPPRKKRRIDPALLRVRTEKKIARVEREVARIEREPRQLIPILEYQYISKEISDLEARPGRKLEDVGISKGSVRAALRLWNFHKNEQSYMETISLRKVVKAQERALETLKQLDEDLYHNTVNVDEITLIPYISSHMRKETAPNPNYSPPDGFVKDITKEWVM